MASVRKTKKDHLPQSEQDWLETGMFDLSHHDAGGIYLRTALSRPIGKSDNLLVAVGGIPREPERRLNLPLINKLYGHLAILMANEGWLSLLYNQPGTGDTHERFHTETLGTRSTALRELVGAVASKAGITNVSMIGMSAGSYMSGRVAGQLAQNGLRVRHLILQSPAAYPIEAETIAYGPAFTAVTSSDWDIVSSPVFADIEQAAADGSRITVSFFENDDPPIPLKIQEAYNKLVARLIARDLKVSYYSVAGVEHNFRRPKTKRHKNVINNDAIRATAQIIKDILLHD